jgi:hypothetical protein
VKNALNIALLAAGLAACGATPQEYRNDKEQPLPSGQGACGNAFTWEWRKKDAPAPAAPAPAAAAPTPSADANKERQEFEEWRAWQEWKKKNQK